MTNNFEVYIKFGMYHGQKSKVIGETEKDGNPCYELLINTIHDEHVVITKKQKNTIRVLKG